MDRLSLRVLLGTIRRWIVAALLAFVTLSPAFGAESFGWLEAQFDADGAPESPSAATAFQATAETLRTLAAVDRADDAPELLNYLLRGDNGEGVEALSRRIVARAETGGDPGSLVAELAAHQNEDGGFGERAGFQSTVLDTTYALEALATAGHGDASALAAGISFLAAHRAASGGWAIDPRQPPSLHLSARVLTALWPYRHQFDVSELIAEARQFVLGQRGDDGAWGDPLSTALALNALYPALRDKHVLDAGREQLLAWRMPVGSWEDDIYTTALALRALDRSQEPYADLGLVSGTVIDGNTDAPLSGVSVALAGPVDAQTVTGAGGTFQLEDLEPGTYEMMLTLEGYAPLSSRIAIETGTRATFGTLRLLRSGEEADTGIITGRVIRHDTGAALEGVRVSIQEQSRATHTDAEGRYQLQEIAPGSVTVRAEMDGYHSAAGQAKVTAGSVALFSPALKPLTPAEVTVEGIITRQLDGAPLAGATVTVGDGTGATWSASSDGAGYYRIVGLPSGTLTVSAEQEGYWSATSEVTVESSAIIRFSPSLAEQEADAPPPASQGGFTAVIRDAVSGQSLAEVPVVVTVGDESFTADTDVEGEVTMTELPVGSASIEIQADGFETWTGVLEIAGGVVFDAGEIQLYPVGYHERAGLTGHVVDAVSGKALENVAVEVYSDGIVHHTTTGPGGRFEETELTRLEWNLRLSRSGYQTVELGLVLIPGQVLDLGALRLRPAEVQQLKPDLTIGAMDLSGVEHDPVDLTLLGSAAITVENIGTSAATAPLDVLAFYDVANDGVYDPEVDIRLGTGSYGGDLDPGTQVQLAVPLSGRLPFRDAPIRFWVDSAEINVELDESNNYATTAGNCVSQDEAVALDLAMCMDASGSVSWSEFQLQLEGTAAAIENPEIIPHDGTVRVSALQFSSRTRVELPPTVVTRDNAEQVAAQVRGIRKLGGGTSIHSCINSATALITQAEPASAIKVIDVSTDGRSSRSAAIRAAEAARDAGVDTLNAIGVGRGIDYTLLESIVFPQPAGGERGFVLTIDNYDEYEAAIAGKVSREVRLVDLTVGALSVEDGGPGHPSTVEVVVGNAGTGGVPEGIILRLQGIRADGTVAWQDELELDALPPASWLELEHATALPEEVVELVAIVDPAQSVGECNRDNNRVTRDAGTHLGGIGIAADASSYAPGADVLVTGNMANTGSLSGRFRPVVTVEDGAGQVLARLDDWPEIDLAPGEDVPFSGVWNTADYLAGPYRLRGRLVDAAGEVVAEAETGFRIVHASDEAQAASLQVSTDRPTYHTSDVVALEALARNLTSNTLIEGARVRLVVTGPDGTVVMDRDRSLPSLAPGGRWPFVERLVLDQAVVGHYSIHASLRQGGGTVLASAESSFLVAEDVAVAITGEASVGDTALYQGDPQLCTFELHNRGSAIVQGLPVQYATVALGDGTLSVQREASINIEPGSRNIRAETVDTRALAVGHHACLLRAEIDGEWRTLDHAPFEVLEPPIRIESTLDLGPRGRLLVLLDDGETASGGGAHDPHGPVGSVVPVRQRAYLETLLQEQGWSYTIVTDAEDFTRELRSGGYALYLLLSEQLKLPRQVAMELREAVHRGEGLVVAGEHDQRHGLLDEPLGIHYRGKQRVGSVTFTDLTAPGQALLPVTRHAVQMELNGARAAAYFGNGAPAIADHAFGEGRAVYMAFDWLLEAASAESDVLAGLLEDVLTHVHPEVVMPAPGGVLPLRLTLANEGVATPGRAVLALPHGSLLVDAGSGEVVEDTLVWHFDLSEKQMLELDAWLRMPGTGLPVLLDLRIDVGEPGAFSQYDRIEALLKPVPAVSIVDAQVALDEGAAGSRGHVLAQAERWLVRAADAEARGDWDEALSALVEAADRLDIEQHASIRSAIGRALHATAWRWWLAP